MSVPLDSSIVFRRSYVDRCKRCPIKIVKLYVFIIETQFNENIVIFLYPIYSYIYIYIYIQLNILKVLILLLFYAEDTNEK